MRCTLRGSFLGNQNKVCEKKEIYSVNRFNDVLLLIKSPHSGKPVWLRELFIFIFSSCTPFHRVSTLSIMILLSERVLTTKASHYKPRHVGVKFWKRTLFMKIKISKKLGIKKDSKARVNSSIEPQTAWTNVTRCLFVSFYQLSRRLDRCYISWPNNVLIAGSATKPASK